MKVLLHVLAQWKWKKLKHFHPRIQKLTLGTCSIANVTNFFASSFATLHRLAIFSFFVFHLPWIWNTQHYPHENRKERGIFFFLGGGWLMHKTWIEICFLSFFFLMSGKETHSRASHLLSSDWWKRTHKGYNLQEETSPAQHSCQVSNKFSW